MTARSISREPRGCTYQTGSPVSWLCSQIVMVPSPISLISSETAILLGLAAFPGFKDCRVSGCVPVKQCQAVTTPSVSPFFHKNPERSEEHTSELQSLMHITYAVFCLKKKTQHQQYATENS